MLELKNVTKFYNSNGVVTLGLRNINLSLDKGEIVAITGDSGSGKSTLLNVITGVDTYEEGEILFYGNETSYFDNNDMDAFRKNNVSFIYQKYNIIDSYTVLENVTIPLYLKGLSKEEANAEALRIIEKVGLKNRVNHRGSKLSGGEKQRCVIARALASDSPILACDEPTGNLDSKTGDEIIKLIEEVSKDRLVLIVTHNYDQVKDIVTRRIKISDGEIVEDVKLRDHLLNDENKKLDLKVAKINRKTLTHFAGLNIKNTPKKTILVNLVFLVVTFITLILSMLTISLSSYTNYYDSFNIRDDSRLIVYNKDHTPLDKTKLTDYEYYSNAFMEDKDIEIYFDNYFNIKTFRFRLTNKKISYNLKWGRELEDNDDNIFIILPNNYFYADDFKDISGQRATVKFGEYSLTEIINLGNVSGVGFSSKVENPTIYLNKEIDPDIYKLFIINNTNIYYGGMSKNNRVNNRGFNGIETIIHLPINYDKDKIIFMYQDIYKYDYDLKYVYENTPSPYITYGTDILNLDLDLPLYEATIYSNDLESLAREINNLGFMTSIPAKSGEKSKLDMVTFNIFVGISLISLVCLFFISYAIISRIYVSKSNDYGILRALGVVRGDLGFICKIETITLCMVSSIVSLVIGLILKFSLKTTIFGYLPLSIIPIYFVLMFGFSYLLARRFNNHLFKFSLNTTLREGDE